MQRLLSMFKHLTMTNILQSVNYSSKYHPTVITYPDIRSKMTIFDTKKLN
jgi:hypothetical protein